MRHALLLRLHFVCRSRLIPGQSGEATLQISSLLPWDGCYAEAGTAVVRLKYGVPAKAFRIHSALAVFAGISNDTHIVLFSTMYIGDSRISDDTVEAEFVAVACVALHARKWKAPPPVLSIRHAKIYVCTRSLARSLLKKMLILKSCLLVVARPLPTLDTLSQREAENFPRLDVCFLASSIT